MGKPCLDTATGIRDALAPVPLSAASREVEPIGAATGIAGCARGEMRDGRHQRCRDLRSCRSVHAVPARSS